MPQRARLPHETYAAEVQVVRGRCRQHLQVHSTAETYSGAGSCLMWCPCLGFTAAVDRTIVLAHVAAPGRCVWRLA